MATGATPALAFGLGLVAMAATWLGTRFLLGHAIRHSILDLPNERSSHHVPTPRGGGAAIAAVVLVLITTLGFAGIVEPRVALGLVGGGMMVAVIGWLDDRQSVGARTRATVHFLAALWAVYWLGWMSDISWGEGMVHLGPSGSVIAVLAIVWSTNLYNFMDGIDGLAAVEAVTTGGAAAVILLLMGAVGLGSLATIVAGASVGFLIWNWMPARIFMGDVGSGFLGFTFAAIGIASERAGAMPWYIWLMLLLVFVTDATATLVRRVMRGDSWYTAHRRHAYQRLTQVGLSHARVAIYVAALNIVLGVLGLAASRSHRFTGILWVAACVVVGGAYVAAEARRGMWADLRVSDRQRHTR